MENKKKRVVIALGGNALGNTLPEQMTAVKITAKAIVDLIEEGCEVIVAPGNGPQVGMINNAMAALSREDSSQPNTPLSVCVAMSQAYIGYDLQNALREELYNREIHHIPVATMITQVRVDADDPAFDNPTKPIGHFMTAEQAKTAEEQYGYIMREDAGRGYRRVVASPKPAEIVEIGAIRSLVNSGQLVIACGGGGIPVTRQGNHLKGTGAVIERRLPDHSHRGGKGGRQLRKAGREMAGRLRHPGSAQIHGRRAFRPRLHAPQGSGGREIRRVQARAHRSHHAVGEGQGRCTRPDGNPHPSISVRQWPQHVEEKCGR